MDKFDVPEPKKIAPQLTAEQRQAMAPIDLLVQYIMPKLWDKMNYLEWMVKAELHGVHCELEKAREYSNKINAAYSNETVFTKDRIAGINERLAEVERGLSNISTVNARLLTIANAGQSQPEAKPKRGNKKKAVEPVCEAQSLDSEPRPAGIDVDISEPVAMDTIAVYDAQTDMWVPKVIDGVKITEAVVNAVISGDSSYSTDVMAFIYDLSESERKVLCAQFPD